MSNEQRPAGGFQLSRSNRPADGPDRVCPGGELGVRLTRSAARIQDPLPYSADYLLAQVNPGADGWSHFPRFHGDMLGRWILAMSYLYAGQAPPQRLASIVAAAVAAQNADGSFGAIPWTDEPLCAEKAYGNGWMLRALCQYAVTFDDADARAAAIRLGDNYLVRAGVWAESGLTERHNNGYAATVSGFYHALDGVVAIRRMTEDRRFDGLLEEFASHLTPMEQADHSHMFLTIRRGLTELLSDSRDAAGIVSLATEMDRFYERHVLEIGGVRERLIDGQSPRQVGDEACSLFDWLLVCLRLHNLTGDGKWMDRAVYCLDNHICFNQVGSGGFGTKMIGQGYLDYGKEAIWCCSLFGPFALVQASGYWLGLSDSTLTIHHPQPGTYTWGDQTVILERDDLAGVVRVDCSAAPCVRRVTIRTPHWLSSGGSGSVRSIERAGGPAIEIPWTYRFWAAPEGISPRVLSPDVSTTKADPGRSEVGPGPTTGASSTDAASDGAIPTGGSGPSCNLFYGPWLLARRFGAGRPQLKIEIRDDGEVIGLNAKTLRGLPGWGLGYRVTGRVANELERETVFRSPGQGSDEIYLYPLKENESPMGSAVTVRIAPCCGDGGRR